jgi:hypothetical protein
MKTMSYEAKTEYIVVQKRRYKHAGKLRHTPFIIFFVLGLALFVLFQSSRQTDQS